MVKDRPPGATASEVSERCVSFPPPVHGFIVACVLTDHLGTFTVSGLGRLVLDNCADRLEIYVGNLKL